MAGRTLSKILLTSAFIWKKKFFRENDILEYLQNYKCYMTTTDLEPTNTLFVNEHLTIKPNWSND